MGSVGDRRQASAQLVRDLRHRRSIAAMFSRHLAQRFYPEDQVGCAGTLCLQAGDLPCCCRFLREPPKSWKLRLDWLRRVQHSIDLLEGTRELTPAIAGVDPRLQCLARQLQNV